MIFKTFPVQYSKRIQYKKNLFQATVLYAVPPIIQYLISSSNLSRKHTENLKNIICAGAPFTIPDFNETMKEILPGVHFRQSKYYNSCVFVFWTYFLFNDLSLLMRISIFFFFICVIYLITIHPGYGLSEATCFLTLNPDLRNDLQTVGVPAPNTQMKVTDLNDGTDKGANEEGEICFKGPQVKKIEILHTKKSLARLIFEISSIYVLF